MFFKKRSFYFLLTFFVFVGSITNKITAVSAYADTVWPAGPEVSAASAIVMDASTGLILYEKNIYEKHYPASTTKVMTSLLAIENGNMEDIVTCSHDSVFSIDWTSSRIGLDEGEQILLGDAMYAILLASANEVSYAVAEHLGGNIPTFVQMMNDRAAELGCVNTHFVNPHGLDNPDHYSCAYDLALITRQAIQYPLFREVSGTRTYTIPATNKNVARPIANTHRIIKKTFSYDGVFAGKTGYTDIARTCLITCAERNGMSLICVVMDVDVSDDAYTDTKNLLNYGFDNFEYTVLSADAIKSTSAFPSLYDDSSDVINSMDSAINILDGTIIIPKNASFSQIDKEISLFPIDVYSDDNNVIGTVSYSFSGHYLGSADIIYNADSSLTVSEKGTYVTETLSNLGSIFKTDTETSPNLRPVIIAIFSAFCAVLFILFLMISFKPRRRKGYGFSKRRR